ncbi:MAG: hypothetical protein ACO225_06825 [Ilumatobacteraceae bacterium]
MREKLLLEQCRPGNVREVDRHIVTTSSDGTIGNGDGTRPFAAPTRALGVAAQGWRCAVRATIMFGPV